VQHSVDRFRRPVETRTADIAGLKLPDWQSVTGREYERWTHARIVIDTAGKTAAQSLEELRSRLTKMG